jgi:HK97 gp10 family phage protein
MEFDFEMDTGELESILNNLHDEIKLKVTRLAVAAGARIIRDSAKSLAPYDSSRSSGVHLRDAIVVSRVRSTNDVYIIGTRSKGKKAAPHAHLQELGTVKMSPQPFLRPASEVSAQAAINEIIKRLEKGALREAKKLAKKGKK